MTSATDDQHERQALYAARRAELAERMFSNSEAHDEAVLTLSAGLLGLSMAFMTDIVPIATAIGLHWLYLSWAALSLAVVVTVISFRLGNAAIRDEMDLAERYYLRRDQSALRPSAMSKATEWFNNFASAFLVLGIALTIVFLVLNITEVRTMAKNQGSGMTNDAQTIPQAQRVDTMTKAQDILSMQPLSGSTSSATASSSSSSSASTGTSSQPAGASQSSSGTAGQQSHSSTSR